MGRTGFDLQDFLNYFLPGLCFLVAVAAPVALTIDLQIEDLDSLTQGLLVFLLLNLAYVAGHGLERFRIRCHRWSYRERSSRVGRSLVRLLGKQIEDPRKRYFGDDKLHEAIEAVFSDWLPEEDEEWETDVGREPRFKQFYLCWRLLENECPQGVRYHLRTMAIYNFAGTMVGALLLSLPFLLWLACLTPWAWVYRGALALLVLLLIGSATRHFFREFQYYHDEWVRNTYRSFWAWYRVHRAVPPQASRTVN